MKHLLIAMVVAIGLAFSPVAEAMCTDADCAIERVSIEKSETPAKALHVCACHHHSTSGIQFPAAAIATLLTEQQMTIAATDRHMVSAIVSPLLEPPSHA